MPQCATLMMSELGNYIRRVSFWFILADLLSNETWQLSSTSLTAHTINIISLGLWGHLRISIKLPEMGSLILSLGMYHLQG